MSSIYLKLRGLGSSDWVLREFVSLVGLFEGFFKVFHFCGFSRSFGRLGQML